MSHPVRQFSFSSGEISPSLYARTDLDRYRNGLHTCRNMQVMRQGGVTGRPGTMYVGTTLNSGNPVRLIPFIFNETGLGQSYFLEFGNQYIAIGQNGAPVVGPSHNITAAGYSAGAYIQIAVAEPDYIAGDIIEISGVVGATQFNGTFLIVGTPGTTIHITNLDGTPVASGPSYVSGGVISLNPVRITSPYLQADLALLRYIQSADVITIVHPDYQVRELRRSSSTNWTLVPISNWGSNVTAPTKSSSTIGITGTSGSTGQVFDYQVTTVDSQGQESDSQSPNFAFAGVTGAGLDEATITTPITLSWDAVSGASSYRVYKHLSGTGQVYGFIGAVIGTSFIDTGVDPDYTNSYPIYTQFFGNDGDTNNPSTVGFSQQRRYFGNTIDNPVGFWGSQPGAFSNFDVHLTSEDDDAVIGSIAGEEVNAIETITELRFMLMLTAGAEIYVQGDGSGVVKPSAINASTQSQYGCSALQPIKASDALLFNQSLGSFIRDFAFDFAIDGYRGNDITIFASHLFEGYQINDWCFQKVPDSIIWAVRSDGVLLSCTYIREQEVLAWARHDFVNGFVENVCSIPENGEYAVYVTIRRVIDGETVLYLERVSSRVWRDPINATYLDCFSEYNGTNESGATMTLGRPLQIVTGINDGISFDAPFPSTPVRYHATIPAGYYSIGTLVSAIPTAMNAAKNNSYEAAIVPASNPPKIEIATSTGPETDLVFSSTGDPANYSRSANVTLGYTNSLTYSFATSPQAIADQAPVGSIFIGPNNNNLTWWDITNDASPLKYSVTIPTGLYPVSGLAAEVKAIMNATSGRSDYVCSIANASGGKIQIGNPNIAIVLFFAIGDPDYATSIGPTLGFPSTHYFITNGTFTAPNVPQFIFDQSSYAYTQSLALACSVDYFGTTAQVGDQIFLQDALWVSSQGKRGNQVRCTIQSILDTKTAIVTPSEAVPVEFQNVAITLWARAVATVSGLDYLEGQDVSVWADRFVVGSPLNSQVTPVYTVTDGAITLDKQYAIIYVGLPMIQDVESLDLESYFGETMLAKRKRVSRVSVYIYNTRTFFAGAENPDTNEDNTNDDPLFQLYEEKNGREQATYDVAPDLMTRQDYVITPSRWTKNGRVFLRNVDPVPFSLLAIAPSSEDPVDTPYKT